MDWNKHDPAERIFYNGLKDLTEMYKALLLGQIC